MEFLINKGFSKSLINSLKEKYDEAILDMVELEEYNVLEVIDYFKSIGIKDIESIMIYNISLFTTDIDKVKESFEKNNVEELVKDINEDIINIDRL